MAVVQILRGGFVTHDFRSCYILLLCWAVSNLGTLAVYQMKFIPHLYLNKKCLPVLPTSFCPPPGIFQLCPSEQCSHGGWWLCCLPYLRGKTCGTFSQTELLPAGKRLLKSDYSHRLLCHNGNADTAAYPGYNQTLPKKSAPIHSATC